MLTLWSSLNYIPIKSRAWLRSQATQDPSTLGRIHYMKFNDLTERECIFYKLDMKNIRYFQSQIADFKRNDVGKEVQCTLAPSRTFNFRVNICDKYPNIMWLNYTFGKRSSLYQAVLNQLLLSSPSVRCSFSKRISNRERNFDPDNQSASTLKPVRLNTSSEWTPPYFVRFVDVHSTLPYKCTSSR